MRSIDGSGADGSRADLAWLLARPIAHRGLHACGAPGAVENSISAARDAVAAGYGIECDVQLSHDGEAMVFHDEALDRLTGTPGLLGAFDAAALGRLRLGGGLDHVPTLHELLAAISGRVPLVVEIKSGGRGDTRLADRVLDVVATYPGKVALESFDPALVMRCKSHGKSHGRPVGLVGPAETGQAPDPTVLTVCDFVSWSIGDLPDIARHHLTIPRTTWTVRTHAQAAVAARCGAQIVFEGFVPCR